MKTTKIAAAFVSSETTNSTNKLESKQAKANEHIKISLNDLLNGDNGDNESGINSANDSNLAVDRSVDDVVSVRPRAQDDRGGPMNDGRTTSFSIMFETAIPNMMVLPSLNKITPPNDDKKPKLPSIKALNVTEPFVLRPLYKKKDLFIANFNDDAQGTKPAAFPRATTSNIDYLRFTCANLKRKSRDAYDSHGESDTDDVRMKNIDDDEVPLFKKTRCDDQAETTAIPTIVFKPAVLGNTKSNKKNIKSKKHASFFLSLLNK